MRIRFDEFCLDSETRQLTEDGEPVELSPKALQLLQSLVEKRPAAVSMRELYRHLWPDTYVEKANLRNLVAEIRAATRDPARSPRLIRTVFGFGYAFIGQCRDEARSSSAFHLVNATSDYPLAPGENIVGRDREATVVIEARGISRRHARIVVDGAHLHLEDLGSKNGTWVGAERVDGRVEVGEGAEVRFGHLRFWIRSIAGSASTLTEA